MIEALNEHLPKELSAIVNSYVDLEVFFLDDYEKRVQLSTTYYEENEDDDDDEDDEPEYREPEYEEDEIYIVKDDVNCYFLEPDKHSLGIDPDGRVFFKGYDEAKEPTKNYDNDYNDQEIRPHLCLISTNSKRETLLPKGNDYNGYKMTKMSKEELIKKYKKQIDTILTSIKINLVYYKYEIYFNRCCILSGDTKKLNKYYTKNEKNEKSFERFSQLLD
jgi:hypothetical protein